MELSDDILVLQNLVRTLLLKIEEQANEITVLKAENVELRNRLNQNSSNSSLPPSSDKFKAKPAFVKVSKGKPGGQEGHQGKTLSISYNPDIIEKLLPSNICNCGFNITDIEPVFKERRQVYDPNWVQNTMPVSKGLSQLHVNKGNLFLIKSKCLCKGITSLFKQRLINYKISMKYSLEIIV